MCHLCRTLWLSRCSKVLLGTCLIILLIMLLQVVILLRDIQIKGSQLQQLPLHTFPRKLVSSSTSRPVIYGESEYLTGKFKPAFTPEERRTMLHLVDIFDKVCTQYNITYFLYGGSLLGSYRHHDLIPWDDDIDVIADVLQQGQLIFELAALAPEYQLFKAGPRLKFFWNKSQRTSDYPWNWPYLDVSFFVQNSTHIWDQAEEFSAKYIYPKYIIFPLHRRPLAHLNLNSPHDSYQNLVLTYDSLQCESHFYSHRLETGVPGRREVLPCRVFKDILGFVYRKPHIGGRGILETLRISNKIIHTKVVEEPSYAISNPFSYDVKEKRKS